MELTLNQAAKECGRAKSTLSKAIKTGKLSAETQDDGSYRIAPAELFRVFPKVETGDHSLPTANPTANAEMAREIGRLEEKLKNAERVVAILEADKADLKEQRDKWQATADRLLLVNQNTPKAESTPERRGFFARMMKG